MSSNPIRLQKLLQKYLAGTASTQELQEFWKLMSELSDNDLVQLDLKNLWDNNPDNSPAGSVDWNRAYHVLQGKIDSQEFDFAGSISLSKRRRHFFMAAAACILLFASALIWKTAFQRKTGVQPKENTVQVKHGRHQTISLPDGTMVTLNDGSKLDYPQVFNQSSRDVYLTGEAYFDVKHDAHKPFLVHTGKYITRVLGTAFNIRAYDGDTRVSVTVTRGKVQVQSDSSKKTLGILSAGDQLVIDKTSSEASYTKADIGKVTEWKANDMIFDNATVDEAVIALGNRYGVTFLFEHEALRTCRFTANFAGDGLNQSLDVICTLINASWVQAGPSTIELKGRGCE
jgi:ferric-dicitrate binding protein FerR (iron transport regulator)